MILYGVYVLSEDPPVLSVPDNFVTQLLPLLPKTLDPTLLIFPTWTMEVRSRLLRNVLGLRKAPRRRMNWMCTTPHEATCLGRVGYEATWCHQNLYCDESKLSVDPGVAKRFDAVYTAQIMPFKRLELAREIRSLRVVTGRPDLIDQLPGLGLGHSTVNDKFLDRAELNVALNESRVGLALSAVEGGMLACTEYLLCGLPVVSTHSIGGRDVWLDRDNARIVGADPAEVAAGVRDLVENPPDPHAIRAAAVRRARHFRMVLAEVVRRYSGRLPFDADAIDGGYFVGRFVAVHFLKEYLESFEPGGFARKDLLGKFL